MAKRKRDVPLLFWVSKQEKELIEEKWPNSEPIT